MKLQSFRSVAGLSSLYLFFCSIVVSLLFIAGNMQSFLESTNRLLLDILEWVLFIFIITNMYYLIFTSVEYMQSIKTKAYVYRKAGSVWAGTGLLYGIALLLVINALLSWL